MNKPSELFTQPYDFSIPPAVICDESNNTPDTVDRNELCITVNPMSDWRDSLVHLGAGEYDEPTALANSGLASKESDNYENDYAWFRGICKCGHPVVVSPSSTQFMDMDYHWYCANKKCAHHNGEDTNDTVPEWVVL